MKSPVKPNAEHVAKFQILFIAPGFAVPVKTFADQIEVKLEGINHKLLLLLSHFFIQELAYSIKRSSDTSNGIPDDCYNSADKITQLRPGL